MGKVKGILIYTLISVVYAVTVLNLTGTGSRMGKSGLRNYLLRGTAFLPVGIAALILLGALMYFLMSGGQGRSLDSRQKGAFGAAGLILLALVLCAAALSARTIKAYGADKAGGPRYMVLTEAALKKRPARASLHTVGTIVYTLSGVDEKGKTRFFYLSQRDVENHGILERADCFGVTYYPESGVAAEVRECEDEEN